MKRPRLLLLVAELADAPTEEAAEASLDRFRLMTAEQLAECGITLCRCGPHEVRRFPVDFTSLLVKTVPGTLG